jgi:hypothetical protein
VTVTLQAYNGSLELIVSDTGIGIAPDDLARLGRPYVQAKVNPMEAEGTGLGLSLVRALAQLHGGDMALESRLGEGTAVTIRFPAALDVPTVAEQGLAGFEHVLWQGFFVPKGTPPDVIKKISDDVLKILSAKSVTDNMASKGISAFPLASAPFREYYVADIAKWRKVVKSSGIVLQ